MLKRSDIQIRDPFILPILKNSFYYIYGTTDQNCWGDHATGFDCYQSKNLELWEGPFPCFRPSTDFWADRHFWAPEVYEYNGGFYMFASFKSPTHCRGTQVLRADKPEGPFVPHSDGSITPHDWECLDGTLYLSPDGTPWIVFCREWCQVGDGEMWAMKLTPDLASPAEKPILLFHASDAPWVQGTEQELDGKKQTIYVTDGPFLYTTKDGTLLMLWSSGSKDGYAIGIARSDKIDGAWTHDKTPLFSKNGGHGMIFRTFDGTLYLSLHSPNNTPMERPCFYELEEENGTLVIR
jgi:arabinan endo-1,5-alpha-L-arabinosidase